MAEWITAIAALIAAIATVAYFFGTLKIFREAKRPADAADQSARAADSSARTAVQTVSLMRQQMDEQAGLGDFRVESATDSAIAAIEAIPQPEPLRNINVGPSLSTLNRLLEQHADAAVSHAARTDRGVANKLSAAFQLLRTATSDLRDLIQSNYPPGHSAYTVRASRARQSLVDAIGKFRAVKQVFTGAGPHPEN